MSVNSLALVDPGLVSSSSRKPNSPPHPLPAATCCSPDSAVSPGTDIRVAPAAVHQSDQLGRIRRSVEDRKTCWSFSSEKGEEILLLYIQRDSYYYYFILFTKLVVT